MAGLFNLRWKSRTPAVASASGPRALGGNLKLQGSALDDSLQASTSNIQTSNLYLCGHEFLVGIKQAPAHVV